jgi:hypothetical protein
MTKLATQEPEKSLHCLPGTCETTSPYVYERVKGVGGTLWRKSDKTSVFFHIGDERAMFEIKHLGFDGNLDERDYGDYFPTA